MRRDNPYPVCRADLKLIQLHWAPLLFGSRALFFMSMHIWGVNQGLLNNKQVTLLLADKKQRNWPFAMLYVYFSSILLSIISICS